MRIKDLFRHKAELFGAAWAMLLLIAGSIIANAQNGGVITGRVVNDDGSGVPNLTIYVNQAPTGQRGAARGSTMAVTNEDGNFRVTGLSPSLYTVNIFQTKEYAMQPSPTSD